MNSLQEIAGHLRRKNHILITAHIMPDGDAIGSMLGLGLALRQAEMRVTMFSADGVPERYTFLEGANLIVSRLPKEDYDCIIALDCADQSRLMPVLETHGSLFLINIDHHPTNSMFGHCNYVDAKAAATGEIVFALLEELAIDITHAVAHALYVAVSTDTGSFKFESTTEKTHLVASRLLAAGVRPGDITPRLFDLRQLSALLVLRQALCSLALSEDGKIAWLILTREDMQKTAAKDEDLDGVVNYAKNIEGVEVGLIFRENHDGSVKVGFRSHTLDVAKIAATFGGGGHIRASGSILQGNLKAVVERVLATVRQELAI